MADYLIHYNKNHSKANGQFVSGDGDGDGIVNDHAHAHQHMSKADRLRNEINRAKAEKKKATGWALGSLGATGVGYGLAIVGDETQNKWLQAAGLVSGTAGLAMSVVASVKIDKANKRLKQKTSKLIDEHYGMPLSEALDELQRS